MYKTLVYLRSRGGVCLCVLAAGFCVGAWAVLYARHPPSLLETANKLGSSADALLHGRGLAVCYGDSTGPAGTQDCFHAQRMPLAPALLALLYILFRDHGALAALVKMLLCLAPVLLLFVFIFRRAAGATRAGRGAVFGLLLAVVLLPPTLDLAVNLNFEEAYLYGWLALAVGLLLFPESSTRHPWRWAALACGSAVLCYLTKSSLLIVSGFLAMMAAILATRHLHRTRVAVVILCTFAAVPLLWGVRQRQASGRFTLGTSLDGVNFYKGNNPLFLEHYPAFRGASLDSDEAELFSGHVSDTEEWDENDFGLAMARAYIEAHPADTSRGVLRKLSVFFFSVDRNAGEEAYNPLLELAFTAGLLLFRFLLLSAMAFALWQLLTRSGERFPAAVFLGSVVCAAAPYIAGFALTRHATILILPAATYVCRMLLRGANVPATFDAPQG